jgi:hypothetical protein
LFSSSPQLFAVLELKEQTIMATLVNITKHDKLYLNENGIEVYPPGHPYAGMVKPESERARDPKLPPKSLAEEKMEIEASIDDEARQAMEVLRKKGLIN